jgi:glutamate-1-semialdehyde 2,1-aminomutase
VSSSVFVYCYAVIFSDLTTAMCLGLASLFARQFGHAVLEPVCHDKEELLLGYTTRQKTLIVVGYVAIPLALLAQAGALTLAGFIQNLDAIARYWFGWTLFVVAARVIYLIWKHDFRISMIWFVKLVTDPLTDIYTYFPRRAQRA